jgi:hypothetical protein
VQYCLDLCSFVINLKSGGGVSLSVLFIFLKVDLAISGPLNFQINFRINSKEPGGIFLLELQGSYKSIWGKLTS